MTAREVTVALSGTGGDELFGGYNWFNLIMKLEKMERVWACLPRSVRAFLEKRLKQPGDHGDRGFRARFNRFLSCRSSFLKKYCLFKSMIHDENKPGLYSPAFFNRVRSSAASESLVAQLILDRAEDPTFEKIAYLQLKTDLPDILLKDADHMSMAHGLEIRLPLLDQRLVRLAAAMPPGLKIGRGDNKAILREAARDLVPGKIIRRPKMGFIFPMDIWAHTVLRDVIASVFTRDAIERRGYFRYEPVRRLYDRFLEGRERFFRVWNLAALELWHRVHIDGRGPDLDGLIK
jgi:asparagine synthase (glutamine-hydrolysing)